MAVNQDQDELDFLIRTHPNWKGLSQSSKVRFDYAIIGNLHYMASPLIRPRKNSNARRLKVSESVGKIKLLNRDDQLEAWKLHVNQCLILTTRVIKISKCTPFDESRRLTGFFHLSNLEKRCEKQWNNSVRAMSLARYHADVCSGIDEILGIAEKLDKGFATTHERETLTTTSAFASEAALLLCDEVFRCVGKSCDWNAPTSLLNLSLWLADKPCNQFEAWRAGLGNERRFIQSSTRNTKPRASKEIALKRLKESRSKGGKNNEKNRPEVWRFIETKRNELTQEIPGINPQKLELRIAAAVRERFEFRTYTTRTVRTKLKELSEKTSGKDWK